MNANRVARSASLGLLPSARLRSLKRRISDAVYRQLIADSQR
jgi:hypothetical protein